MSNLPSLERMLIDSKRRTQTQRYMMVGHPVPEIQICSKSEPESMKHE